MRQPYQVLLGQYLDHPILGRHLWGDEPDWSGLATDPELLCLSTGEWLMIHAAHAFRGDDTFRLSDLGKLDHPNRNRIITAIYHSMGVLQ